MENNNWLQRSYANIRTPSPRHQASSHFGWGLCSESRLSLVCSLTTGVCTVLLFLLQRISSNVIPAMRLFVKSLVKNSIPFHCGNNHPYLLSCFLSFPTCTSNLHLSVSWPYLLGLVSVSHPQCLAENKEKALSRHFWGEWMNQWGRHLSSNFFIPTWYYGRKAWNWHTSEMLLWILCNVSFLQFC